MIGKLQKISRNIKVSYHMLPVKYTPAMQDIKQPCRWFAAYILSYANPHKNQPTHRMQQRLPPGKAATLFSSPLFSYAVWLQDSGFKAGHTIDIRCEDGKIIISKPGSQRWNVK